MWKKNRNPKGNAAAMNPEGNPKKEPEKPKPKKGPTSGLFLWGPLVFVRYVEFSRRGVNHVFGTSWYFVKIKVREPLSPLSLKLIEEFQ